MIVLAELIMMMMKMIMKIIIIYDLYKKIHSTTVGLKSLHRNTSIQIKQRTTKL